MTAIPIRPIHLTAAQQELSELLDKLADDIDVPAELQRTAHAAYCDLGQWIKVDSEGRFRADAEVYVQGSAATGTMVKCIDETADVDVDLVYRRDIARASVSQKDLMEQAGDQLERYLADLRHRGGAVPALERGRRCWTLRFTGYHLDVLPAIPDEEALLLDDGRPSDPILITDKELREWQHSNPRGYAAWFDSRQSEVLMTAREGMARKAKVDVQTVPVHTVKTPLRQAVRLLKRHRDRFYDGDPEHRPISIVITTLAALAYRGEQTVYEAIVNVAGAMRQHIIETDDGYCVENPVNDKEDFCDKWTKSPEKADRFFAWLTRVEEDLARTTEQRGIHRIAASLSPAFGKANVEAAVRRSGEQLFGQRESGELRMAAKTGTLGVSTGTVVRQHTFYGRAAR